MAKKTTEVWKSLPVAQTRGIQMWLLLGHILDLSYSACDLFVCPGVEHKVQKAVPMAGGFLGHQEPHYSGIRDKPKSPYSDWLCHCHQLT